MPARPEIAVLIPLIDPRGDAAAYLRSWTDNQTLARDRYQVVVASDGVHRGVERALRPLLVPHDVWVEASASHVSGLLNAAAAGATSPWLLITEAHCTGDPRCLETLAATVAENPELEVASLEDRQAARSRGGELCVRWFTELFASWEVIDQPRLSTAALAIRRRTFHQAGGLDESLGMFGETMLAARLHERGCRIAHIPGAAVVHMNTDTVARHDALAADFTRGECAARERFDSSFCERNFGYDPIWNNRMRYRPEIARTVRRALIDAVRRGAARPADTGWMLADLGRWTPSRTGAPWPVMAVEQARMRGGQVAADHLPVPKAWRWRAFQHAFNSTVRLNRLRSIRAQVPPPAMPTGPGIWQAADLDGVVMVGSHGLEEHEGRAFRWTEPVAILRLAPGPTTDRLSIDTAGLRGDPSCYVAAVYAGQHRIANGDLWSDDRHLEVRFGRRESEQAAQHGVILMSRPLRPNRHGSPDRRRLGMPVASVEWRSEH